MREFKPNFISFFTRSFYSIWVLLFLFFVLFLSIYDIRNSIVFLVVGMWFVIHSQIFAKRIIITDKETIEICFLHGPKIISFKVNQIRSLLLSNPLRSGSLTWGLLFRLEENSVLGDIKIDFTYWTKEELIKVFNEIMTLIAKKNKA